MNIDSVIISMFIAGGEVVQHEGRCWAGRRGAPAPARPLISNKVCGSGTSFRTRFSSYDFFYIKCLLQGESSPIDWLVFNNLAKLRNFTRFICLFLKNERIFFCKVMIVSCFKLAFYFFYRCCEIPPLLFVSESRYH